MTKRRGTRAATTVAAAAALALLAGCEPGGTRPGAAPPAAPAGPVPSAPSAPGASGPAPAPTASGTAAPTPPPAPPRLRRGDRGAEVRALQQRLTELGYWNGSADGSFGGLTQQAVYALQKAAGLGRDGVVGPRTRAALARGVRPKARTDDGRVVEIDRRRQLLLLVDDGRVRHVLNTSTGSNENYEYEGETYLADTPAGRFRVSRQIDGMRDGPLGQLWRPKYFNGGIAVHGAPSVPPYPASHGCARVSNAAMNWLWERDLMPLKSRVLVY